jgi:hypothetical protein
MAYDTADRYVVAVSPNSTLGASADTWTFSAGTWTKLSLAVSPPNRWHGAMAYDAKDGYVLLFGGEAGPGTSLPFAPLADTWTYLNGTWTNQTPNVTNAPSPRVMASMVWDAADQCDLMFDLMFGGWGTSGNITGNLSQTWSYVGGAWTSYASGSGPQLQGALAYDSHDEYALYFGGAYSAGGVSNETWKFHAGVWTNLTSVVGPSPSPRDWPMASDDPTLGGILLFGGYIGPGYTWTNDSWSYANQTWTLLSASSGPSPRYEGQMVFDAADNTTLLFGGDNVTDEFSDTWAFGAGGNGSTGWTEAAPVLRLSQATIDLGMSVTFSAASVFGSGAGQFSYSGLPAGCDSTDAASVTCVPNVTGTFTVGMTANISGGRSSAVTSLRVNPPLQIASLRVTPAATDPNYVVQIQAAATGGTPSLEFAYSGLPSGCASENSTSWNCTPTAAGEFPIVLTLSDAVGRAVNESAVLQVAASPSVSAFSLSPSTIDLSQSTAITIGVTGGVGPFAYGYPTLPLGCTSQDSSRLSCTPGGVGTFAIASDAVDSLGMRATATGSLTVNTWPSIASFTTATPNSAVGDTVTFRTVATGGTGNLAYTYVGLPTGCTGGNAAVLTCSPTFAGTYSTTVTILDAVGGNSTSEAVVLRVAAAPTSPGIPNQPPTHSGSTGENSLFTVAFTTGVLVGLLALAGVGGVLAWRARVQREGARIVQDLRHRSTPDSVPGDPTLSATGPPRHEP